MTGLLVGPVAAQAQGGPFGAGIILGEPSGLSVKYFLDGRHAVDGALDYSLFDGALYLHADYLFHFNAYRMRGVSTSQVFLPYVGIGGKIGVHDRDGRGHDDDASGALGVRIPIGVAWIPAGLPIDIFIEIVPGLFVLAATDPDLDAGVGLRYFF